MFASENWGKSERVLWKPTKTLQIYFYGEVFYVVMIKLASKCVGFNGLSCLTRRSKLPARQSYHRFENYRHELGFKHDWAKLNFVSLAFFGGGGPEPASSNEKFWKNGFRVIKAINQGLFAQALTTLQWNRIVVQRSGPAPKELHVFKHTHTRQGKYWWEKKKIPWNSILLHPTCSFSSFPSYCNTVDSENRVYWFLLPLCPKRSHDFTTIIISYICNHAL